MPLQKINVEPLWGVWRIEESSENLLQLLDNKEWYVSLLERFRLESRKTEWLAVRVLLKRMMEGEFRIDYLSNGAPFLVESQWSVSFSHTKGYVAVQALPMSNAGIDIEYISDRVLKIKNRFLSVEELSEIDLENEMIHLLLHWSAKETVFKALMQQDVDFREHLHIEPFTVEKRGVMRAYETRTDLRISYDLAYLVTNDYVLTYILD